MNNVLTGNKVKVGGDGGGWMGGDMRANIHKICFIKYKRVVKTSQGRCKISASHTGVMTFRNVSSQKLFSERGRREEGGPLISLFNC